MSGLDTSQAMTDQASLQAGGDLGADAMPAADEAVPAGMVRSHAVDADPPVTEPEAAPDSSAGS